MNEPDVRVPLPLGELLECRRSMELGGPLWGGFTADRTRAILETAITNSEKAERYDRLRRSNNLAQIRWRAREKIRLQKKAAEKEGKR